jgi:CRISPR-associated exonuclease Cas4
MDDPLPLRLLNDFLYCPRRCALHQIEGVWVANAYTVAGELAHENADDPGYRQYLAGARESATLLRVERALPLFCRRLNLVGKADIVEFHRDASSPSGKPTIPLPVDYKLGKKRKWDNDDAQLCGQALCLEEMFGVGVPRGAIYHVSTKRRRVVEFTRELRELTMRTIEQIRELLAAGVVPPAELKPQCEGCSLHGVCLPELGDGGPANERAHAALFSRNPVGSPPV